MNMIERFKYRRFMKKVYKIYRDVCRRVEGYRNEGNFLDYKMEKEMTLLFLKNDIRTNIKGYSTLKEYWLMYPTLESFESALRFRVDSYNYDGGYQPIGSLDPNKPPKGGSGVQVPPKDKELIIRKGF